MFKGKTPLLVALVLGLVAGIIAWSAIKKREAEVRKGWDLKPVIVTSMDLSEGTVITTEMLAQRQVPDQFVTASVVKPDSASYVVGQKVLVPMQAGDTLLWSQLETTRAGERLSTKIQKRARALTIEAKSVSAVGGWVRPNDHVGIVGTFKDPDTGQFIATTLMQDVIVLATGRITGTTNVNLIPEGSREYNNVSLLVIPEEVEVLVLAQELGALTLALRNEDDMDRMTERGRATMKTLLDGQRLTLYEQKRRDAILVIRGNSAEKREEVR